MILKDCYIKIPGFNWTIYTVDNSAKLISLNCYIGESNNSFKVLFDRSFYSIS